MSYLLTASLREPPAPWPFLIAPLLLMAGAKYAEDAFYPPYRLEFLSLFVAGAIQGVTALAGWFVYTRWHRRGPLKTNASGELHEQSV